jgi:hypothetical protein
VTQSTKTRLMSSEIISWVNNSAKFRANGFRIILFYFSLCRHVCPSTVSFPDDNLISAGWSFLKLCRYNCHNVRKNSLVFGHHRVKVTRGRYVKTQNVLELLG